MYGILLYLVSVHSLKIKRKWMSDDDQRADVPSTSSGADVPSTSSGADVLSTSSGADVLSTSSAADVPSTSYADWTSVNTDEPQAQTPQNISRHSL